MPKFIKLKLSSIPEIGTVIEENIGWNGKLVFHVVFYGYSKIEFWFADDCQEYIPDNFMQTQLEQWWNIVQYKLK